MTDAVDVAVVGATGAVGETMIVLMAAGNTPIMEMSGRCVKPAE